MVLLPGLPPNTTFDFASYEITKPLPLEGGLAPNNFLDNGERLFVDKLYGPEHLLYHNGAIYTGVHGGEVVKIVGKNVEHVGKFGKACLVPLEEARCGRPLGLALDTIEKNTLVVLDSYYGIYLYNLDTRKETQLISQEAGLDGIVSFAPISPLPFFKFLFRFCFAESPQSKDLQLGGCRQER